MFGVSVLCKRLGLSVKLSSAANKPIEFYRFITELKHVKCEEVEYLINYWDLCKYEFTTVVNTSIFLMNVVGREML
jgi:hypothetical protein